MAVPNPEPNGPFPPGLFRTPIMAGIGAGLLGGMLVQIPYLATQFLHFDDDRLWFGITWTATFLVLCSPFFVYRKPRLLIVALLSSVLIVTLCFSPFLLVRYLPYSWYRSMIYWVFPLLIFSRFCLHGVCTIHIYKARPMGIPLALTFAGACCPLTTVYLELLVWTRERQLQENDLFILMLFARVFAWMIAIALPALGIEMILRKEHQLKLHTGS